MTCVAVVEDHDELRDYTVRFLRAEGYTVVEAAIADELFESDRIPDIYIVDLNLPLVSGFELIERLRRFSVDAGIIIVSARDRTSDMTHGYGVGADIYLAKPVDPDVLLAALRRLETRYLNRMDRGRHCLVDRHCSQVRFGDNAVDLSAAEVKVLHHLNLAGNAGLERWELMEILDMEPEGENLNALEVRISRLRRKLKSAGLTGQTIGAVRHRGYRLLVPMHFT